MRTTIRAAQQAAWHPHLDLSASTRATYKNKAQWLAPRRRIASTARWENEAQSNSSSSSSRGGSLVSTFPGYNIDLLDASLLPALVRQPNKSPTPPAPVTIPQVQIEQGQARTPSAGESASLSRSRIVFSTRLDGPAERAARQKEIEQASILVAGVLVPPKPEEPDNCCMSGCVNCVWDLYGEEVEAWAERKDEAKRAQRLLLQRDIDEQGKSRTRKEAEASRVPADAADKSGGGGGGGGMDDDGGGSDANWSPAAAADTASGAAEDVFRDIPVGIREFMRTEKKLKMRLQQKRLQGDDEHRSHTAAG